MAHNPRAANPSASVPRILDRLAAEKKLTREQYDAVVLHFRREGGAVDEAIIDALGLSESDVLKMLAAVHKTRFVASEKLASAAITAQLLNLVPRKLAERATVLPVLIDNQTATLSVVTPDPENVQVLEEVRLTSRARDVKAFVGRTLAIKAAIAKLYAGDATLFAAFEEIVRRGTWRHTPSAGFQAITTALS